MSKELIDGLRYLANRPPYSGAADIMLRAADALETKAAPVGEREAFEAWLGIKPCGAAHDLAVMAFKAGAAHQRQQAREVVMPDVSAMARVLSDRAASACCVDPDDNWKVYGQEFIEDVRAMLASTGQEVS